MDRHSDAEQRPAGPAYDELADDELPVLPDQTRDDTDRGWGEDAASNDRRLLDDRPPHWQ